MNNALRRRKKTVATAKAWTMREIVIAAVISVAAGLLFRVFDSVYPIFKALATVAYPPLIGLYSGVWMLAGVLGAAIVRKPGAALFCELVAASLSASLGSVWGIETLLWGLVQGVGAETVFFMFGYRRYGLAVTVIAGSVSALCSGLFEVCVGSKIAWRIAEKYVYLGCLAISGAVIVGGLSWWLVCRVKTTGVLRAVNSGNGMSGDSRRSGGKDGVEPAARNVSGSSDWD